MSAAGRAAHNAMPTVTGIDPEPRDRRGTKQRAVVRGHGVLAGLDDPVGRVALPDRFPEGDDPRRSDGTRRIKEVEGKTMIRADILDRWAGRGRGIGTEEVGAMQRRAPMGASVLVNGHWGVAWYLRHVRQDDLLAPHRGNRQVDAGGGGQHPRAGARSNHRGLGTDRACDRLYAGQPATLHAEAGHAAPDDD